MCAPPRSLWVASRSVALPLPSSPHWAPRITIAGMPHLSGEKEQPRATAQALSGALATPRYQNPPDRVPPVDPLLVITNSDAGTADEENLEAALDVLRAGASVEVAATSSPGELDSVLHRAGSR